MARESIQQSNPDNLERQFDALSRFDLEDLTPEVSSYFNNLFTQASQIIQNNKNFNVAPIEILQRLKFLITKLKHVAKTKEIPPEDNLIFKRTTLEGKEVILDLARVLEESNTFYQERNLADLAQELPQTIKLSDASRKRIQEALDQGFDKAFLFPSAELLTTNRDRIIEECATKPLPGLSETDQYTAPCIVGDTARTSTSNNRPIQKYYLLLYKSEIPPETKGLKYPEMEALFTQKKWKGLTLDEHLIFQRKECKVNRDHRFDKYDDNNPDRSQWSFLLDAVVPNGRVDAAWDPVHCRVNISMRFPDSFDSRLGARPAVVVELE